MLLFIGDDWAEDHVRHEALEVERRGVTFAFASETAAQVVIGDPTDPKTQVGPVISA
ncbi:hypothetical protein [Rhodococcus sp. LB1]|uniref:hypothetical protein n=1 Tax=Rhodococcus sp. LB1 TaxID=1807499 RepID=UPI000B0A9A42|nr:hypothetical protein [Rhodococcus sp. LB1]